MNKKGQIGLGGILVVFIGVIVGLVLFLAIAQTAGVATSTVSLNESIDTVVNDTTQYLTNWKSIEDPVMTNETGGTVIGSGNYTITNNVLDPTTGALSVSILPDAEAEWRSAWIVTGTGQAPEYVSDSSARAIVGLISIFFALAVVGIVLGPTIKEGLAGIGN